MTSKIATILPYVILRFAILRKIGKEFSLEIGKRVSNRIVKFVGRRWKCIYIYIYLEYSRENTYYALTYEEGLIRLKAFVRYKYLQCVFVYVSVIRTRPRLRSIRFGMN